MNGVNGASGSPGLWQEARNADGRVYYYNSQTKVTQWSKPVELMTSQERALADQPWKEYTAEGGRKYWYNTESKQSTWEIPEVYKNALSTSSQSSALPPKPSTPANQFVAGSFQQNDFNEPFGPQRQIGFGQEPSSARGPTFVKSNDPEYNTYEEAEAAFTKMLKRTNVQPDWTWEQTMRATIKDPQFRSVKDPKDRKAAFEKYVTEVRIQEKDRAKERLAKLRTDFATMLKRHGEIKHYTRWQTARPIIEHEAIFRTTDDDNERRQLFEEYIIDLKKSNAEREAVTRKTAMDELVNILNALELEPYTRWSEAQSILQRNDRFSGDQKFKTLSKSDVLTAFENHIKSLERKFNDERQRDKATKARRERQNRDRYIDLLKEAKAAGKIKAGTKWSQIRPEVEADPRYTNMLGQPGSSLLDLFRDMVEEEERGLRLVRNDVYDVLEDRRYEVSPKTQLDEFVEVMQTDRRTKAIPHDTLVLLFERLLEKVNRRSEEDKHASERQNRRAIDALRSRIKHLDSPPVQADSTWEAVRSQISQFEEYKALDSEDLRRQAFDKVIRRLKEKEEDLERERERRRERERDRDRDRDRDYRDRDRDRDRDRRHRRTSRSPEPDAYEADRRKAMADRERQYRKSGPTGLSPPPRDRRPDDRERRESAYSREGRLSYDRGDRSERDRERERHRDGREDERERLYRLRGDPRSSRDELDYGGGAAGSSSGRRRRDSEGAESISSRKRVKRERSKEKEKEKETKKEEIAMHSGSEEGEMVEE